MMLLVTKGKEYFTTVVLLVEAVATHGKEDA